MYFEAYNGERYFAFFGAVSKCKDRVAGLRPTTLLKKRLWHRRFPVNFVKFLRTPFLRAHLGMVVQM